MLRNRRTIIFTLVFPAALLLVFGGQHGWHDAGRRGNVAAYILVSMALYGAALTAAARRLDGRPRAGAGLVAPAAADPAEPGRLHPDEGARRAGHGRPRDRGGQRRRHAPGQGRDADRTSGSPAPWSPWSAPSPSRRSASSSATSCPGENAMQILGPGLALLSFLGGVFIPIDQYIDAVRTSRTGRRCTASPRSPGRPLTHELPVVRRRQRGRSGSRSSWPAPRGG